jgi:hypothetical protein
LLHIGRFSVGVFFISRYLITIYAIGDDGTTYALTRREQLPHPSIKGIEAAQPSEDHMARSRKVEMDLEPVGIILSFGTPVEESPRVLSYEWAPVPLSELDPAEAILAA